MFRWRDRLSLGLAVVVACSQAVLAQPRVSDVDAAVRRVVVETAVFVEECGKVFPGSRASLDAAFANWVVLSLPIPGLATVLKADSPERLELTRVIAPYLRRIPAHEKDIECAGRYEMLVSKEPTLRGDSADLPPNVLDRYR